MSTEYDPHDTQAQAATEADEAEGTRRKLRLDDDALQWLMSDKRGRRHIWRQLELTGVFRNPFSGEPHTTAFECGKQAIGQTLMAQIHRLCPEKYTKMVEEAKNA